jgi:transposase
VAIVSQVYPFVIGVDTHARNHVIAIVAANGQVIGTKSYPVTAAGMARAIAWVRARCVTDLQVLWVIEGVATYGATLAKAVADAGFALVEAPLLNVRAFRGQGKSDQIDASRIGQAVLPLETSRLRDPRTGEGVRAALRVLVGAVDRLTKQRTADINYLTALLRRVELGLDARKALTEKNIKEVASWRTRQESMEMAVARQEAVGVAKQILQASKDLTVKRAAMRRHVQASPAAGLLDMTGIGEYVAASLLLVWSHPGRIHSEAAFARLIGVAPIPASSGNTQRHRLSRGGDRQANKAIHIIANSRAIHDPETRSYLQKRMSDPARPKNRKEAIRIIKRYIARDIYRHLEATTTTT